MHATSPRNLSLGIVCDLRKDYLAEGHSEEEVAEFDSDETVAAIESAMRSLGYRPELIGNSKALCRRLVAGNRWDLVFNIAEGLHGRSREAQSPALLELYEIPYAFSDPLTCAVTLDKAAAKKIVRYACLPTPDFTVVESAADVGTIELRCPLFVKPIAEGTGKGIGNWSLIDSPRKLRSVCIDLLRDFNQPVLVEEYLPGREFTTGILGTGSAAKVLGTMEIEIPAAGADAVYSLDAKEQCEKLVRYSPLRDRRLRFAVEKLALAAYVALECRDAGRVDIRLDARGKPSFLELNPLPGLHPTHSDLPMIATQAGMSYQSMIGAIIKSALRR